MSCGPNCLAHVAAALVKDFQRLSLRLTELTSCEDPMLISALQSATTVLHACVIVAEDKAATEAARSP